MQCPTCGSRVPDGADVCPDCGMDLQSLSAPTPNVTPNAAPVAEFAPAASDAASDNESGFETFEFDDFSNANPEVPTPDSAPLSLDKTEVNVTSVAPSNQNLRATLTLKRGGTLTEEKFVIGAMASIGRFDPESGPVDVDMANLPEASYVSRHHAEIRGDENGWHIKDLGSRNGTFVRAASGGAFTRVQGEHAIHDGDEISLGNARFEFRTEN